MVSFIGCIVCTVVACFIGRDPALEAAKAAKKRGETVEKQPVTMVGD